MSVRRAAESDLDRLSALSVGIQQLHAEGRPDLFRAPDREALRTFLADQLASGAIVLIADLDGTAAGYLLAEISARPANPFRHASKSLYVHHIAVDPAMQRRGIGKQLMDAAVTIGRAENVDAVRLDSWSFNHDAHTFFESEGFAPLNVVFERRLL
ncbi:GNAT family N-acetyltransferase [Paramicrobacterium chengjingii]|uniref:GNAT family N-acetyltransferase n=1 Tax=Paramicrobacterium chengjingii TaxID=2769067 RepID=A0ABX6YJ31_9MICO|nr:GNAT family N-acetyltransferase [Microbacterium chengjingii]QPZ38635.1 GNAT family N-acetyltransferase [Microbacterium chengjingii]